MPEFGPEDEPLTLDELVAAVHATGFTIRDDGKGGATLARPPYEAHVPSKLTRQLTAAKPILLDLWPVCDGCGAEYWWLARRDVGRLCDKRECPRRTDR